MNDILDNNSGEAYMQAFIQYMLGFAEQFQEYCKKENINIANEKHKCFCTIIHILWMLFFFALWMRNLAIININ